MTPAELFASAIGHLAAEGADATLEQFPELIDHRALLMLLQDLEDQRDEAELRIRQIDDEIEATADQLRQAVGAEP